MRLFVKLGAFVEYLRGSLWFGPTVGVVAAVVLGLALTQIRVSEGSMVDSVAFPGGAEGARSILVVVSTSIITATTLVFSLTVLTLQLASQQFSPRLLRTFLREGQNQVVLGVFLATFVYSLVVLLAVRSRPEGNDDVPGVAVTVAFVLVLASIAGFVTFIGHIAESIRIDTLMKQVEKDTRSVIDAQHPEPCSPDQERLAPSPPTGAVPVPAHASGFVTAVAPQALKQVAVDHDVVLALLPKVGERVVAGCPLALAWPRRQGDDPPDGENLAQGVNHAVAVTFERTMQQDIAYGLRELVDVAVKALSPGVNDPTTAVHAIGHLASLLCVLAGRDLSPVVCSDGEGVARVAVMTRDLEEYLDLVCRQIRLYGARDAVVAVALLELLRDVSRCAPRQDHRRAVKHQAAMVVAAAEREIVESYDLDAVRRAESAVEATEGEGQSRPHGRRQEPAP